MSETLPDGWTTATLGDLCVSKVDQGAPGSSKVPYIDISAVDRETKSIGETSLVDGNTAPTRARQWVRSEDVLVSMTRPNLNAVALVPDRLDGAVSTTGFDVLRAIEVEPEWLFFRVRSTEFVADVCEDLQGVVYPAIRPHDVRAHELPLPPLAEQRRIVDEVNSYFTRLDDAIATLERVERKLARYRASVLKAAVEGKLVPTEAELAKQEGRDYEPASELLERALVERRKRWEEQAWEKEVVKAKKKAAKARRKAAGNPSKRGDKLSDDEWLDIPEEEYSSSLPKNEKWKTKYKEPATPDTSGLTDLPSGWAWASLEQLGQPERPYAYGVLVPGKHVEGGVPLVRVGDIGQGVVADQPKKAIAKSIADKFKRTYLTGGELLMSIVGTIGRVGVASPHLAGANVARAVAVLPIVCDIDASYLVAAIQSPRMHQRLVGASHEVARKTLNMEDVRKAPVPLPPALEQARIVGEIARLLSVLVAVEQGVDLDLRRCSRLRQSILKWAFEGKLADQNPDDEPADVLLARIKAERKAAKSNNKPTRGGRRKTKGQSA